MGNNFDEPAESLKVRRLQTRRKSKRIDAHSFRFGNLTERVERNLRNNRVQRAVQAAGDEVERFAGCGQVHFSSSLKLKPENWLEDPRRPGAIH